MSWLIRRKLYLINYNKMRIYRIKKITDGYIAGYPEKKIVSIRDYMLEDKKDILIQHKEGSMKVNYKTKPLGVSRRVFRSKFGGKSYRLVDYEWKPAVQEKLL